MSLPEMLDVDGAMISRDDRLDASLSAAEDDERISQERAFKKPNNVLFFPDLLSTSWPISPDDLVECAIDCGI